MNLFETIAALLVSLLLWWGGDGVSEPFISAASTSTATVLDVVDGDTIVVSIDGREETVRYIGIDTPEPYREGEPECGSHEATEFNRDLVAGKTVGLVSDVEDRDRYDRLLRYVYVGDRMINRELIAAGLATPLTIRPNITHQKTFVTLANEAKASKRGSWALCINF